MSVTTAVLRVHSVVIAKDPEEGKIIDSSNWKGKLNELSGGILVTCLTLAVVALVLAATAFIYGKVGNNSKVAEVGISAFPWLLVGAAVMGSASWVVAWGSGAF